MSMRFPIEPAYETNDIHSRRGQMLKMRFFLANRTGTAQTHPANSLRNGAFHSGAVRIYRIDAIVPAFCYAVTLHRHSPYDIFFTALLSFCLDSSSHLSFRLHIPLQKSRAHPKYMMAM